MSKKKEKSWIRPRHKIISGIAAKALYPYAKLKYGIHIEKFKEQGDRQYLILYNHQTVFDQFFIGMAFKPPVYYVATEDIFSNGWVSSLIRFLVAPIPIKKQTTDLKAVKNCVRVAKEGGTIAIAPEGNRTYSGKTEYMNPAIVSLAKLLKLPIVLFRIEGGYGVQPRWSDVLRKGKMRAFVSEIIEPEVYEKLSNEELLTRIREGLYVNEAVADGVFSHTKRAEYLERAMYVCPYCGPASFESKGEIIRCKTCDRKIIYQPSKELQGVDFSFPFPFVAQWYDYQKKVVSELDLSQYIDKPMFEDQANVFQVIINKRKNMLRKNAKISLYGDRVAMAEGGQDTTVFPYDEVTAVSVLGRNKLNIYHDKNVYQLKGDQHFNALKYVNIYYRYKNVEKEGEDGVFLGL